MKLICEYLPVQKARLCDGVAHFIRSIMFTGNILRGFTLLPPRCDSLAHYMLVYLDPLTLSMRICKLLKYLITM